MTGLAVHYSVSASRERVAEALVDDVAQGQELVAAATAAGTAVAWAHSTADLSPLGFRAVPGYRRLAGPALALPLPEDVMVLTAAEDSAELCAAAFRDQWGHKTPGQRLHRAWPRDYRVLPRLGTSPCRVILPVLREVPTERGRAC